MPARLLGDEHGPQSSHKGFGFAPEGFPLCTGTFVMGLHGFLTFGKGLELFAIGGKTGLQFTDPIFDPGQILEKSPLPCRQYGERLFLGRGTAMFPGDIFLDGRGRGCRAGSLPQTHPGAENQREHDWPCKAARNMFRESTHVRPRPAETVPEDRCRTRVYSSCTILPRPARGGHEIH